MFELCPSITQLYTTLKPFQSFIFGEGIEVGEDVLEIWGDDIADHYRITYNNEIGEMVDVVQVEDELVKFAVGTFGGVVASTIEP